MRGVHLHTPSRPEEHDREMLIALLTPPVVLREEEHV